MQNLLKFPDPRRSQQITREEWSSYVRLLRDMESVGLIYEKMRQEVAERRESILARLERGGSIEAGGRITR